MAEPESGQDPGLDPPGMLTSPGRRDFVIVIQALVRPVVTFAFAGGVVWGWVADKLSADAFLGLAGMTIGFWFTQRESSKTRSGDQPPSQ